MKTVYFVPPGVRSEVVWAFQRNDTVFFPLVNDIFQEPYLKKMSVIE